MSRSVIFRLFLVGFLVSALFTGCSRDPNVRKQKYLESGDRYFEKGKYAEAAIQYSNAIQLDSRFAQAHYQLGETYLKQGDRTRAFQELSRTVRTRLPITIVPTSISSISWLRSAIWMGLRMTIT